MKKQINLLIVLCMLAIACAFFPFANTIKAEAVSISAISGNKIVLTGLIGNTPHYFTDDNDKSTLVNAQVKNTGGEYYSLVQTSSKMNSSGYSEYRASTDMEPFIEAGLLYAKASAKVSTNNGTNVELILSAGTLQTSAKTDFSNKTSGMVETELIKLKSIDENIKFYFETSSTSGSTNFQIDEPTIHIYTQINSVTLASENQFVTAGQMVKVEAFNEVTNLSGVSGNFIKFSKLNHAIQFDFETGGEFVKVVGSSFVIADNAPEGTEIRFRAYAKQNSYSNDLIYSTNTVVFTVSSKINVVVNTDFDSPAAIYGEGLYAPNRQISLTLVPNKNFNFLGWYVNGEKKSSTYRLITTVNSNDYIFAKFTKNIKVENLVVRTKVYDGTTNINQDDVIAKFDGVENGHEVKLCGANYSYTDATAGEKKQVNAEFDKLWLEGKDSDLYVLPENLLIPTSFGKIEKRSTVVTPSANSKQYGDLDPDMSFKNGAFTATNMVEGQTLAGQLGREPGEAIGKYTFTIGELESDNTNYRVELQSESARFEIVRRTLTLDEVDVKEKVYDGTVAAEISAHLNNIYKNEDVSVVLKGAYASANAGVSLPVSITSAELEGADKNNYTLKTYDKQIFGSIAKRELIVKATNCTFVYGNEFSLGYTAEGLLGFDSLYGQLEIDDAHVGEHKIKLGSLNNDNYQISFVESVCTIVARPLYVNANKQTKIYGEADPELTCTITNLVDGDSVGVQLKRVDGQDVGDYAILLGELSNADDYNIIFTTNVLQIMPREIGVEIEFLDKIYDGTTDVEFEAIFTNKLENESFILNLNASLLNKDSGVETVVVENAEVLTSNVKNYSFNYKYLTAQIVVSRRSVYVVADEMSKFYGEADPAFTYTANGVIPGESLTGALARNEGEIVGKYAYYLGGLNNFANPNYNIILIDAYFEIKPKTIYLSVNNYEKVFGDEDPELEFDILTELAFNEKVEDVFTGSLTRQKGEKVGVYSFDASTLWAGNNYVCEISGNPSFIINKRPVKVVSLDNTKIYGDDDPNYDYYVENDVEGEELSVQIRREYGEDVGEYELICATINDPRYTIDFVPAKLTITPATIGIKADENLKVYGDDDPVFNFLIVSGVLKNNDRIDALVSGQFSRQAGEQCGVYEISRGNFSLGGNYEISFETGSLRIIEKEITVSALPSAKVYGDKDPSLPFKITYGELVFNDLVSGSLLREAGEDVGSYNISRGNLKINENYIINFEENQFSIVPKRIEILPTYLSKQYGDLDQPLSYNLSSNLLNGDILSGELYREKGNTQPEEVGKYKLYSSLAHKNYEIILADYYFTILPRTIVIEADSFEINYGAAEPNLTYKIVSGNLLDGDSIRGRIYRVAGNSVGSYDIISELTINKNYNLVFVKGTVNIVPLNITIKTPDRTKVYGESDPNFHYEIVDGTLINGDELFGNVVREEGEDVGEYRFISAVYNLNYKITLMPAKLTILKKDAYLITGVFDKIYDGNTNAKLRNPYLSGLIDKEVYLDYDFENCANFASSEIGNNISVVLHDIRLTGEKAFNYNLIMPNKLTANITQAELHNNGVVLKTADPNLYEDCSLKVDFESINNKAFNKRNQKSVLLINIYLEQGEKLTSLDGQFIITIKLPENIYNNSNIYVYQKNAAGGAKLVSSHKGENGEIVISANHLGEFYITTANDNWLNFASYISTGVIILILCFVGAKIVLKSKKKKSDK